MFGYFGSSNFGNEAALQAMLFHLRRWVPDADLTCICADPRRAAALHAIRAVALAPTPLRQWAPRGVPAKALRKLCVAGASLLLEPFYWIKGMSTLRRTEMLIMPGGGLLTDAHGLSRAGPYTLLRWTLIAHACRCTVVFLSVGAGPLHGKLGRLIVRLALSLADVRSYRDESSKLYLDRIGFHTNGDLVYPDLVFSLPESMLPARHQNGGRRVVGLAPMESLGHRGGRGTSEEEYRAYIRGVIALGEWLISRGYVVRLLVGDYASDLLAKQDVAERLRQHAAGAEAYVIDDPITSVEHLLSELVGIDLLVTSRFHGVLLGLLCGTPTACISFDNKLDALMATMGMSEYCLDGNSLEPTELIDTFQQLETAADGLAPLISARVASFREVLDQQYQRLFDGIV